MNFPLFETLCIENGTVKNIALHQQRYEQSLHCFYAKSAVNIYDILQQIEKTAQFSTALCHGLVRCRFDYNRDDCLIRFFPYQRTSYRTFKPIVCDEIDYALKYNDRTVLTKLFDRRDNCDEVIIIKQGKVTDCTIGNLVFRKGSQWLTPDTPLLNGTQRQRLLAIGKIREHRIRMEDIASYDEIRLINAMNDLNQFITL